MTVVTRPTSLAAYREQGRRAAFPLVAESAETAKGYQAQPADLFISPFPKSGTTWLQHIVHGLKTCGDMTFDDISRVVPWLETAQFLGIDLDAPQPGGFRAFKSHLDKESQCQPTSSVMAPPQVGGTCVKSNPT